MSARAKAAAVFSSVGILAAGWQLSGAATRLQTTSQAQATSQTQTTSQTPITGQDQTTSQYQRGTTSGSTSAAPTSSSTGSASASGAATSSASSSGAATSSASSSSGSATSSAGATGTFTGATASHRYGSVTVTVTMASGKITAVNATVVDDGESKSQMINSRAVPVLKQRVLAAGNAQVSTVSGATYTSEAYLTSLQSALDKA